jgi:peptide/nickel transport system substrate-binding protein
VVDRLKVAIVSEREGNDPVLFTVVYAGQLLPMYEALVRFDENAKYVPMLATSWEISPDLKNWTFNLRKGVQWHRGFGEFTVKDVVHNDQRHARPESVSVSSPFIREQMLPNTEVVDEYKITYHLPAAKLDMDVISANHWYNLILSKAHFDKEGQAGVETNPVGTGPYQYVKRVQGAYILYERVPYKHYRVTPDFPELQMFFVKEHATRLAMLLAGEVEIAALPSDLEPTAVRGGMKVISARIPTVPVYTMFGGNFYPDKFPGTRKGTSPDLPYSDVYHPVDEVPWVHKKVREALNRAVNRDEIQATILGGKGQPMPVAFFHSSLPGWNPEWQNRFKEKYGYDPKRAKELLAEVEAEIGKPLDWSKVIFLLTLRPELPQLADLAEAVANYWKAIGANVKLEEREFAYFRERIVPGKVGGVAWTDATIRFEDPRILQVIYYSHRNLLGICCHFFERDAIDTLYEKLVPETDFAKRAQYLREAGNYIFEEYGTMPLVWLTADFTVNPKVVADYALSGQFGMRDLEYVKAVRK